MLNQPDKDPSWREGTWQGTIPLAHRGPGQMSQGAEAALRPVRHIVVMKDQMEAVQFDKLVKAPVQAAVKQGELAMVLAFGHRQAVDDGIYKLHQTCIVQFSHNRNTLSDPVVIYKSSSLEQNFIHDLEKATQTITKKT